MANSKKSTPTCTSRGKLRHALWCQRLSELGYLHSDHKRCVTIAKWATGVTVRPIIVYRNTVEGI